MGSQAGAEATSTGEAETHGAVKNEPTGVALPVIEFTCICMEARCLSTDARTAAFAMSWAIAPVDRTTPVKTANTLLILDIHRPRSERPILPWMVYLPFNLRIVME